MIKKLLTASAALICAVLPAQAVNLVGVNSNNELISFDTANPLTPFSITPITGLFMSDGTTPDVNGVMGNIAYNPNDGLLYGLDLNGNFYSLTFGGAATLIDATFEPVGFDAGFAYDSFTESFLFVSDQGENVLIASNGQRTVNPNLNHAAEDPNSGVSPQIFGAGIDYLNGGSTYFVDANLDTLSRTFDPQFIDLFTVGGLGIDVTSFGGLVVDDDGNLWASLSTDGLNSGLFMIDTETGAATEVADFGTGVYTLATVPEPAAVLLIFLSGIAFYAWRRPRLS